MPESFEDQGGVATMDPSPLRRWLSSKLLSHWISPRSTERRRAKAERARVKSGAPHRVEYFHQVEDGYSHLAVQLLRPLLEQYDVELVCHLVTVADDRNLPEPDLLLPLSRLDAAHLAPHYGLRFPQAKAAPDPAQVKMAEQILASAGSAEFPEAAVEVGDAVWAGDASALDSLASRYGRASASEAEAAVALGTARRAALKHYSAAMFHYGGEWYWGADRFYHLEGRLAGYGARKREGSELICPRPAIENGPRVDDGSLTFEIYPSLRSPYTAVIFDKAVALARDTGVKCVVRPVLPMVMRGVPATQEKGWYIFSDAAREARALGLDFGPFYDPIGDPVRRAYSLYPWASQQGLGTEFLASFLRAAFYEGVNTARDAGLRRVVERVGLSWAEAQPLIGNDDWKEEIEANRLAMYGFGSWGVPSFRLLDARGEEVLALWGQDRLWLFAREIQRLLNEAG
ncbi:MAG: DsbA family protein [Myxococcota bacterium]